MPDTPPLRWIQRFRPHDFVWLLLFSGLVATARRGDAYEIVPLVMLGVAQVLEPKFPAVATRLNRIFWIVLKLVLGYVLIGFTMA